MTRTTTAPTPHSYAEAAAILDAGKTAATRDSRKIANNTTLNRNRDGSIAVTLHRTDVVTFHKDGSVTFDTEGWNTSTTRARLNAYAPGGISFYCRKGTLYYVLGRKWDDAREFVDGMRYDPRRGQVRAA